MAAIQTGTSSGKKAIDHEIPLVPFIDLLLCCVMFLLATAVWTQLAALTSTQRLPGPTADAPRSDAPEATVILQVEREAFVLGSTAGDRLRIPAVGGEPDYATLRERLSERRSLAPNDREILVAPDDGIHYERVIAAMDLVHGAGFTELSLADGALP